MGQSTPNKADRASVLLHINEQLASLLALSEQLDEALLAVRLAHAIDTVHALLPGPRSLP